MEWNHLPVAGGLYDQHPDLLKKFDIIFEEQAKYQREQADKAKAESERARKGR